MQKTTIACVALGLTLTACSKSDQSPSGPPSAAKVSSAAAAASKPLPPFVPTIGGTSTGIYLHFVEVAIHEHGAVEARIQTLDGAPIGNPAKVKMLVTLRSKTSDRERVELAWEPSRQRFVGHAPAQAELVAAAPLGVEVTTTGAPERVKLEHAPLLRAPEFGGSVLAAGSFGVEVVAKSSGEVQAYVRGEDGAILPLPTLIARATARGVDGKTRELSLPWDAKSGAFMHRAGAAPDLSSGPLQVRLGIGDSTYTGGLGAVSLLPDASHGGRVLTAGAYSLELVQNGAAVNAYVNDASGKPNVGGDLDLWLAIGSEAGTFTRLAWDARKQTYNGKLARKLDLATLPIRALVRDSHGVEIGGLARAPAAIVAQLHARAQADNAKNDAADAGAHTAQLTTSSSGP
ncbi:MAG TPA: hypothetical protein VK524_23200 [Polyangiaceae bacterium]|nr:hypothetical protein [Polyangiaceae bacterium]